jgi:sulfatase maturation enzyme AslB (radical SAM superfamily)
MRKEDGTPYNAGRDDLNDARNAEIIKDVRVSMMKGEWNPECERCRQEELNGIKSRREYESDDWDLTLEDAIEKTNEDGSIDPKDFDLEFFDIRYGNFCNLKCRMCGPTDSHSWYEDHVKLYNTTKYKDTHDLIQLTKNDKGRWSTDQYDWFKNSNFYWNNFEKHTGKAKKLYIVGGEPLIIEEHFESLERLVASGRAKNIQIEYNSNLTNVTDRMLKIWENFKQVRIGVSIDGYGDVFEYQRTPAKWKAVYKNMQKLNDNEKINFKGWFAFTVTPFNVFHLPEFMKWKLEESGLSRYNPINGPRPVITHHMCHSPKYYNVKVLPQMLKDEVCDHYQDYIDWVMSSNHSDHVKKKFAEILDGVMDFMNSENYATNHLQEFIDHTKKLDLIRNQNILDVVPQYGGLFGGR